MDERLIFRELEDRIDLLGDPSVVLAIEILNANMRASLYLQQVEQGTIKD